MDKGFSDEGHRIFGQGTKGFRTKELIDKGFMDKDKVVKYTYFASLYPLRETKNEYFSAFFIPMSQQKELWKIISFLDFLVYFCSVNQ